MDKMSLAVKTVLSKYATFSGRASRAEFWWWVLAVFLITLATQLIDAFLIAPALGFDVGAENAGQPLSMLFSLAILLPALAVAVRRLHDIGKSGWWLLLNLVPLIGSLILLWFYTRPGEETNQWGPPNPLC
ncbi:DUF805 domain-containing protein [Roseobacter sp.]|uniref:DUF805 domain-containing protein n=1 Tax=Roseobacter sp. TaxID=1907202 RepID=UPI0025ECBA29|nr:DUF805 domain-containing protein [Roseobacter sp.]